MRSQSLFDDFFTLRLEPAYYISHLLHGSIIHLRGCPWARVIVLFARRSTPQEGLGD